MLDIESIDVQLLDGSPEQMHELQRVLESAPNYAHAVTGLPFGAADAQSTYSALPEGKSYEDKFVFGILAAREMVGCADVIRGYPDAQSVLIGLLLIGEPLQRRGIGSAAFRRIEATAKHWGECRRIRVGVVRTNAAVLPFWHRLGFRETGELKPYRYAGVQSETIVLQKPLGWCSRSAWARASASTSSFIRS